MTPSQHDNESSQKRRRNTIFATETYGLLLIALALLVFTVIRYWHVLRGSGR